MPPPAATQAAARLWTARAPGEYQPTPPNPAFLPSVEISCKTRFTRGCVRELKNGHNSVTVQNRTHVYMNFFHHKNLGNHLLQLCPKVVKQPVYYRFVMHGNSNIRFIVKLSFLILFPHLAWKDLLWKEASNRSRNTSVLFLNEISLIYHNVLFNETNDIFQRYTLAPKLII